LFSGSWQGSDFERLVDCFPLLEYKDGFLGYEDIEVPIFFIMYNGVVLARNLKLLGIYNYRDT
jgi:hypothetical protein